MAETKRNTPRDVFLHLLAIVTLYWSAGTFITLLFQFVNYAFPDPVFPEYYASPMRYALASLIIVFPVFVLVSWFLNRYYSRDPQAREMKLRKWLVYFTIFAASLLIIGDLVSIILTFLNGEITARFILKALSIIVVAATVLGYYLDDVRRASAPKNIKYFVWTICAIVLIAIISAFFVVGSPKSARLVNFDQQKISNLQDIQYNIINYWQRKQKLPGTLADLTDNISGFVAPLDPQTNVSYEYIIKDQVALSFELCANFNKAATDAQLKMMYPQMYSGKDNWNHTAGRVCFERNIDKQLYPPLTK